MFVVPVVSAPVIASAFMIYVFEACLGQNLWRQQRYKVAQAKMKSRETRDRAFAIQYGERLLDAAIDLVGDAENDLDEGWARRTLTLWH